MGNQNSLENQLIYGKTRSQTIDKQLKLESKRASKITKILLLGGGESGKSTIVKQMKILHSNGFTEKECLEYRKIVYSNAIESLRIIMLAMNELQISFVNGERKLDLKLFLLQAEKETELNRELANLMKRLWTDIGTQMCFERSSEYQLHDSAK